MNILYRIFIAILFTSLSFSTTIHVATTGSDDTGDGSEQNPYATIEKAITEADYVYNENYFNEAYPQQGMVVSDSILVHDGTYGISSLSPYYSYGTKVTIISSMNGPGTIF